MTPEDFFLPAYADFKPLEHPEELLGWLQWRYGFSPDAFTAYRFWQKLSGKGIFIAAKDAEPILAADWVSLDSWS